MAYRVIVVDPGYSVKKAVRMALSESEFEIFPFQDVPGVLEQISGINPDVVLISSTLSLKNLGELHKQLHSQDQFQKTSFILIKGLFEPLKEEKMSELDPDFVLQAPFDSRTLEKNIRALIEMKNDPQTLPEEPFLDDWADGGETDRQEEKIRALVREETSEVEKKLEKKIKHRFFPEMKTWLREELEEIKKNLERKE